MVIGILGWGSLIWNPKDLKINKNTGDNGWYPDGASLPIEFARISSDERLTLVINEGSKEVITLYSYSLFEDIDEAILDLAVREGCGKNKIGFYLKKDEKIFPTDFKYLNAIKDWCNVKENIDAIIWANLESNFTEQSGKEFSKENVINYLSNLSPKITVLAEEYIRKTPKQIETTLRKEIENKFGINFIR